MTGRRIWIKRVALLVIAGGILGSSGCAALAVGAVATGGVATYALLQGGVRGEFHADVPNTSKAAQQALKDMGLPVLGVKNDPDGVMIGSRTGDGDDIDIWLEPVAVRIPAEGPKTRAQIRVGMLGDKTLSERLLEAMGKQLQPIAGGAPVAGGQPQTAPPPLVAPGQTAPPPVAGPGQTGPPPLATTPQAAPPVWQRAPAGL